MYVVQHRLVERKARYHAGCVVAAPFWVGAGSITSSCDLREWDVDAGGAVDLDMCESWVGIDAVQHQYQIKFIDMEY